MNMIECRHFRQEVNIIRRLDSSSNSTERVHRVPGYILPRQAHAKMSTYREGLVGVYEEVEEHGSGAQVAHQRDVKVSGTPHDVRYVCLKLYLVPDGIYHGTKKVE